MTFNDNSLDLEISRFSAHNWDDVLMFYILSY
ncbi:hypothetical protein NAI75_10865 [Francisella tularensis subsp. holarctica]|nr:hypothetical protein [Francisella tularensis]MDE5039757.1 hypothetical protein [Francisella tularensis subsp. holarctica]